MCIDFITIAMINENKGANQMSNRLFTMHQLASPTWYKPWNGIFYSILLQLIFTNLYIISI